MAAEPEVLITSLLQRWKRRSKADMGYKASRMYTT